MFCFHPLGREFHLFFSRVPQGENSSSLGQKFSRQEKYTSTTAHLPVFLPTNLEVSVVRTSFLLYGNA
jgi:hypothetical protein